MSTKILPWLITLCALGLGGTAGYYSVIGLSKLFAGEATAVIIMASFLEASKLVLATLLHAYWRNLNFFLRTYYILALIVLSLITSIGIYGMLSNGYQKTASQLSIIDNQKSYIDKKIQFYQNDLDRYDIELEKISNNISVLSNAKATTTQIQDKSVEGGVRSVVSTTELRLSQQRISLEEENRKNNISKRQIAADSLQNLQLQVLELENNTEISGELGPLKYVSTLTGKPMDVIINWLLLIIIFVFDPLAISLVIAANFSFERLKLQNPPLLPVSPPILPSKEIEVKKQETKEVKEVKEKISQLEKYSQDPNLSGWRKSKIQNEIKTLNTQIENEDETITY